MERELFSKIIDSIEKNVFAKEINIDENKFIKIKKKGSGNKVAFIDGGQAELLKAVNFSLQFIRTVALVFENNQKVYSVINEFFVLVSADYGNMYKTEIFPVKGSSIEEIRVNSMDPSVREGNERASISKIGSIVRRFAELELSRKIIDKLNKGDFVVLDGSLKSMVSGEGRYIKNLFEKARETEVTVCSLAKTSKLLSENGGCIASQLNRFAGEWHYETDDESDYITSIVRLNKLSEYVFEFNIFKEQRGLSENIFGALCDNSNDSVFPGYPYGLIQADKFARVSNEERDYWLTMFKANAGKRWNKIKQSINALNAHEVLDKLSF